jgi:hypothetical protein
MMSALNMERADGVQLISRYKNNDKIISLVGIVAVDDNNNSDITIVNAEDTYVTKDEFETAINELKKLINNNGSTSDSTEEKISHIEYINITNLNDGDCEVRLGYGYTIHLQPLSSTKIDNFNYDDCPDIVISYTNGNWNFGYLEIEIVGSNIVFDIIENNVSSITDNFKENVHTISIAPNSYEDCNGIFFIKNGNKYLKIQCFYTMQNYYWESHYYLKTEKYELFSSNSIENVLNITSKKDNKPYPYLTFNSECEWVNNFEVRNIDNTNGIYTIGFNLQPNYSKKERNCNVLVQQKDGYTDKFTIYQDYQPFIDSITIINNQPR